MAKQQRKYTITRNAVFDADKNTKEIVSTVRITGQFVGANAIPECENFLGSYTVGESTNEYGVDGKVIFAAQDNQSDFQSTYEITIEGTKKQGSVGNFYSKKVITEDYPLDKFSLVEIPNYGTIKFNKGKQYHKKTINYTIEADEEFIMEQTLDLELATDINSFDTVESASSTKDGKNGSYTITAIIFDV